MLIYRNAEGVHDQSKFGNPWSSLMPLICTFLLKGVMLTLIKITFCNTYANITNKAHNP